MSNFYKGPPFRFEHSNRDHSRFVNSVEYSPDGSIYVTAGGDKKIFIYDGTTGQKKIEYVGSEGPDDHKMSIFSISFSPDGK